MRHPIAAMCLLLAAAPAPLLAYPPKSLADLPEPALTILGAVAGPWRDADRPRDKYRHPAETLAFFGVGPGQTVVELYPSGGWFMRILAPIEANGGHYIAATGDSVKSIDQARALFAANAAHFGSPTVVGWKPGVALAPVGSVDRVLTFRNIHNLVMDGDGSAEAFFAAAFAALKPGGVLGIEEHHLPEGMDAALEKTSGYLKKSTIVRLATTAGFQLAGDSAINANPKDTHAWPKGVWTLPPTYSLGDTDRAKYAAIGESDRMTLKFVKPR